MRRRRAGGSWHYDFTAGTRMNTIDPARAERFSYNAMKMSPFGDFVSAVMADTNSHRGYCGNDGREILASIMDLLVTLCGSEDAAAAWLFDDATFREITGNSADLSLAHGDFWSLSLMEDWLKVMAHFAPVYPQLIRSLFRFRR